LKRVGEEWGGKGEGGRVIRPDRKGFQLVEAHNWREGERSGNILAQLKESKERRERGSGRTASLSCQNNRKTIHLYRGVATRGRGEGRIIGKFHVKGGTLEVPSESIRKRGNEKKREYIE